MWRWLKKIRNDQGHPKDQKGTTITELINQAKQSTDFIHDHHKSDTRTFWVTYFKTMIDQEILQKSILTDLLEKPFDSFEHMKMNLAIDGITVTDDVDEINNKLHTGNVMIQFEEADEKCMLIPAEQKQHRQIGISEIEFSVLGPKQGFIEDLNTNINLLRQRLLLPQLTFKELIVGKMSKTKLAVAYIDGIANQENVNTMVQRLEDIEFDNVMDAAVLQQLISDNSNTIFPLTLSTEKPDRVSSGLSNGKVAVFSEGSSQVIMAPVTFLESFNAREDYYMPWTMATCFRIIRYFAVMFSVLGSPIYVAVLTFHYEMIPKNMLSTLVSTRSNIPFPPIFEALFLELTIELLREAGARLPTKVGQTLGIVGGIVIGQATVAAGMTSDVLLIIVALAALASFTTPIYKMANTIRLLRFPFLFSAAMWGGVGIMFCFSLCIIHLLRLSSLGRPYLYPFYPTRIADTKYSIFRASFRWTFERPNYLQAEDKNRFNAKRAKVKRDIDE